MTVCTRCTPPCEPTEISFVHPDGVITETIYHGRSGQAVYSSDCDCVEFTECVTELAALELWRKRERAGDLYYSIHVTGRGHLLANGAIDY